MTRLRVFFARLVGVFNGRRREARLAEEIETHLAFLADENEGAADRASHLAARRAFGGVDQTKETYRDQWGVPGLESLARETRIAVRTLLRARVFTIVSVATLALGIGATVAMLTVLHDVVLRPLPYPDAGRLVRLQSPVPGVRPDAVWNLSTAEYFYFRREARSLDGIGIYFAAGGVLASNTAIPGSTSEQVVTAYVSPDVPSLLGFHPTLGRLFTEADGRYNPRNTFAPGVILSYDVWQQRFSGDADVVGRTITYQDRAFPIIGVLGPEAQLPEITLLPTTKIGLWLPLGLDPAAPAVNQHTFHAIARLRRGVDRDRAQTELAALTARLPEQFPSAYTPQFMETSRFSTAVLPLKDDLLGSARQWVWLLTVAIVLVFVVAVANVANMVVARAQSRHREIAIRTALGASSGMAFRHALAENLALTLAAAGIGVLAAWASSRMVVLLAPRDVPRLAGLHLDALSALVALATGVGVAVVFALPSLRSPVIVGGADLTQRAPTASRQHQHVRNALVVAQIALALVLGAGAALMAQSVHRLLQVPLGFDAQGVLLVDILLPRLRYATETQVATFTHQLTDTLARDVGATNVSAGEATPLDGNDGCSAVFVEGVGNRPCVGTARVAPGYFDALRIPIRGHTPTWSETEGALAGAVVTESLARRFWPGDEAIGKGVRVNSAGSVYYRVVGVTANVRHAGFDSPPTDAVYFPLVSQAGAPLQGGAPGFLRVIVRTRGTEIGTVAARVRTTIAALDSTVAIGAVQRLEESVTRSYASRSFTMWLLTVAAVLTLLVSAIGLYGVMSYRVTARTSELGVRLALGAQPMQVRLLVFRETIGLVVLGAVVGIVTLFASTQALTMFLFGIEATDPTTLIAVTGLLVAVGLLASAVPAWQASRLDPLVALRSE